MFTKKASLKCGRNCDQDPRHKFGVDYTSEKIFRLAKCNLQGKINLEISKVTGFFHLLRVSETRIILENEKPPHPTTHHKALIYCTNYLKQEYCEIQNQILNWHTSTYTYTKHISTRIETHVKHHHLQ